MNEQLLFVYGTLRRDTASAMYHVLARYAEFVGDATYQGRLYTIDYYPGTVPSDDPADQVQGEVYRLMYPELVLEQLDQYEEFGTGFPEPFEYERKIQSVCLRSGERVSAWVYVYNRPTDDLPLIPSGDFLRQQQS